MILAFGSSTGGGFSGRVATVLGKPAAQVNNAAGGSFLNHQHHHRGAGAASNYSLRNNNVGNAFSPGTPVSTCASRLGAGEGAGGSATATTPLMGGCNGGITPAGASNPG